MVILTTGDSISDRGVMEMQMWSRKLLLFNTISPQRDAAKDTRFRADGQPFGVNYDSLLLLLLVSTFIFIFIPFSCFFLRYGNYLIFGLSL